MARSTRGWFALVMFMCAAISHTAAEPKRVLLLHSFGPQFVPWVFFAGRFREELFKQSLDKIDLYEASLEGSRFQQPDEQRPIVDYLVAPFGTRKLDLIVTIGAPAAFFVQKYRPQVFPSTPLVIGTAERRAINYGALTSNDAPVAVTLDFKKWIEDILQVLPDTTHIAWIVGDSPLERFWTEEFRRASQPFTDRSSFEWFNDFRFEDMLTRVSKLPPHSARFFVDLRVDAAGVPPVPPGVPQYDWRELQHWNISENQLPAGSVVRFREPTVWEQYRWQIALTFAIVVLQGALISGLLFERRRRQSAEVLARQRSAELAHINRYSVAGELTATIAHELNQPLAAILANAETAQLMVKSPTPDLDEIGEILADIRRDDERASDVIGRLRSLLKKTPFEAKHIDLNAVALEAVRFLSALAIGREVDLTSYIDQTPLPIRGDPILLQQVIINLIVNAMDAMSGVPSALRRITLSTARDGDSADLSVSDAGPGIPSEMLKEVFEPFFTTKPEGMGMGLSIARTIVEAHDGQLLAKNRTSGGAIFHVRLPLAPEPE